MDKFLQFLAVLLLLAIVAIPIVWIIDCVGCPTQKGTGYVMDKYHKPEEVVMITVTNGKTSTLIPQTNPERWIIVVRCNEVLTDKDISVDNYVYHNTSIGDDCTLEYSKGRLFNSVYISNVVLQ